MRIQTPLAPGGPASQMLARIVDQTETNRRRAERAERAQRQETEGSPIPAYFRDGSEAVHYAQAQGYVLYWKGTHAFARRQRELGDRLVARPVFTRKGATYVGLVSLDEQEKASEKEPP